MCYPFTWASNDADVDADADATASAETDADTDAPRAKGTTTFRVCPLIEIRQTISLSSNSRQRYLNQQYPQ